MILSLLDFVFPKKCVGCSKFGDYFCAECKSKIDYLEKPVCPVCQRQAVGGRTHFGCRTRYTLDGLVVATRYRDPVKVAVKKVKYKWVYDIEKVLVDLVASQIWKFDIPEELMLAPVPLHKKRKNWRGFNQAEILAKTLAKKFGVSYADLLIRIRETKTQVGLSRDDRKKNVKGAFALISIRHPELARPEFHRKDSGPFLTDQNIMLIDDVYTSGATMAECAKVLKKAGAKSVWGMAVALG